MDVSGGNPSESPPLGEGFLKLASIGPSARRAKAPLAMPPQARQKTVSLLSQSRLKCVAGFQGILRRECPAAGPQKTSRNRLVGSGLQDRTDRLDSRLWGPDRHDRPGRGVLPQAGRRFPQWRLGPIKPLYLFALPLSSIFIPDHNFREISSAIISPAASSGSTSN